MFALLTWFVLLMPFHHTYDYAISGTEMIKRGRLYEQANTFSNFVSYQYPWLNLLYLNFGYHNAHHHDMRCPWYRLPELHQSLYGNEAKNLLPLSKLYRQTTIAFGLLVCLAVKEMFMLKIRIKKSRLLLVELEFLY